MLEGTASRASELKAQGALEAARDPNSSVDAQKAEEVVVQQARAAGAPTFVFDPNATPEQKAAQMKEVSSVVYRQIRVNQASDVAILANPISPPPTPDCHVGFRSRRRPDSRL